MKKRWIRVGIAALCLMVAGLGYLWLVRRFGIGFPCLFYELTGLRCPACGMTHAIGAILRLDFAAATRANPMVWAYLAYGAWFLGTGTARYLRGRKEPFLVEPLWIHGIMAVAILAFGVARNFS